MHVLPCIILWQHNMLGIVWLDLIPLCKKKLILVFFIEFLHPDFKNTFSFSLSVKLLK